MSGFGDQFRIFAAAAFGAIQIDHMNIGSAAFRKRAGGFQHGSGDDFAFCIITLVKTHRLAGDHINCRKYNHENSFAKYARIFSPSSALFSGWNWVPITLFLITRPGTLISPYME